MCPAFDHFELTFINQLIKGILVAKIVTTDPVLLSQTGGKVATNSKQIVCVYETLRGHVPLVKHASTHHKVKSAPKILSNRRQVLTCLLWQAKI
mmetsp:Transcript_36370/g.44407  ORF Transcript_36370/g.44407 Transcript_36370/m.44407 type:complete len:94 (-) Transcript_36370:645-926(-)